MSVNNIKDVKTVDSENFDYLLAESNFRIESVFRSRNKAVIEPNVPVISSQITTAPLNSGDAYTPKPSNTKTGASFTFTIDATDYQLYDLRDAEFDVQAQYAYYQEAAEVGVETLDSGNKIILQPPRFGNQCMLSLFQNIELFIDGISVQRNNFPGFSSNAEYALRYPHCKTLEKDFEVNGFTQTVFDTYVNTSTTTLADVAIHFDNQSITWYVADVLAGTAGVKHKVVHTGIITQRIKLSDIFSVVETLPPLYNHKVEIRFQRGSHDKLICNTGCANTDCMFLGFMKFKLFQDIYNTTDQFIATAQKYYSKPIETLITQDKQLLVPIITQPIANQTQSFNLNVDAAYKNKLLTLCIPRTTDFAKQMQTVPAAINNGVANTHYDTFKAPANSYTYGGLRYLGVSTANGLKLYEFDMENDGVIKGPKLSQNMKSPSTQIHCGDTECYILNYQDVYNQYRKARLHFQQSEDEAIDYDTFIKEYCIFCVDLSCFDLSPNENIRITFMTSTWAQTNYNPYYGTNKKDGDTIPYMSSSIICNLFCDKVLRLLPNRQIQLADLITTNTVEVENSNMA